jgi:hypothetical protein
LIFFFLGCENFYTPTPSLFDDFGCKHMSSLRGAMSATPISVCKCLCPLMSRACSAWSTESQLRLRQAQQTQQGRELWLQPSRWWKLCLLCDTPTWFTNGLNPWVFDILWMFVR